MRVIGWGEPGAILLVSCYELGHQPLGLAWPAAFLERAGFKPDCLDASVETLDPDRIRRARLVAIAVPMHTALALGFQAAQNIRKLNPDCQIGFFGLYASLNAEFLLENGAEFVIGGEFEEPLVGLAERLRDGNPADGPGIRSRTHAARPYLKRISFPVPSRQALPPLSRYAALEKNGTRSPAGYVEASRGCLHTCLHCPITPVYNGRFFVVPQEIVLEDIRRLQAEGVRHITFGDPDFLNGPKHSIQIVKVLHAQYPELTFDITAKVEHLIRYRDLVPEFGKCGCLFVVSAVESLSDTVLANLDKGHTRADVFEALRIVRAAGIILRPSLIPFTPWTTLEDYVDMMEWIEDAGLVDCIDPVQYTVRLLVPPGSALLSRPYMQSALTGLNAGRFTYEWSHPDPRMDRLHRALSLEAQRADAESLDAWSAFARIKERVYAACGREAPLASPFVVRPHPGSTIRLTEPWFC